MKKILAICAAALMLTACFALAACSGGSKSGGVTVDCPLDNGTYTADFKTDSSMFHVNEALNGKGTLTVKDKQMVIHVALESKNIEKLYLGKKEDAQKSGATLIENLCQVLGACAFGLLFVYLFYKGKSLLVCIAAHSIINGLSVFAVSPTSGGVIASGIAMTLFALGYTLLLTKTLKISKES